ncbi:hypothetical protein [Streptomyces sp. NPDC005303]|uniref:hypothetical protein n=1 Tax=Streptomyces sp. NPDC005303 TaxID=3155713 RepID=UPI0033A0C4FB
MTGIGVEAGAQAARSRALAVLRIRSRALAVALLPAAVAVVLLAGGSTSHLVGGFWDIARLVMSVLGAVVLLAAGAIALVVARARPALSPTVAIAEESAPDLYRMVRDLADRLDVPAPSAIALTPDCDSWLEDRTHPAHGPPPQEGRDEIAGVRGSHRGVPAAPVLVIGSPFLWWMRVGELRAVLAPVVAGTGPSAHPDIAAARRFVRGLDAAVAVGSVPGRCQLTRVVCAGVAWVARLLLRSCREHATQMERGVAAAAAERAQAVDYGLRIVAQEQVGLAYAGWDRLLTRVALPAWRMGRWPSRLDAGVVAALTELSRRDRLAEGFASRLGERPACDLLEEPGAIDEAASLLAARLFHGGPAETGPDWSPVDWQEYPEEVVDRKWRLDAARLHRVLDAQGVRRTLGTTSPESDAPTLSRVLAHLSTPKPPASTPQPTAANALAAPMPPSPATAGSAGVAAAPAAGDRSAAPMSQSAAVDGSAGVAAPSPAVERSADPASQSTAADESAGAVAAPSVTGRPGDPASQSTAADESSGVTSPPGAARRPGAPMSQSAAVEGPAGPASQSAAVDGPAGPASQSAAEDRPASPAPPPAPAPADRPADPTSHPRAADRPTHPTPTHPHAPASASADRVPASPPDDAATDRAATAAADRHEAQHEPTAPQALGATDPAPPLRDTAPTDSVPAPQDGAMAADRDPARPDDRTAVGSNPASPDDRTAVESNPVSNPVPPGDRVAVQGNPPPPDEPAPASAPNTPAPPDAPAVADGETAPQGAPAPGDENGTGEVAGDAAAAGSSEGEAETLAAALTAELAREEAAAPRPRTTTPEATPWDDTALPLFPLQPPRSARELLTDHVTAMVCCAAIDTAGATPGLDWLDGPSLLINGERAADLAPRVLSLVEDGDPAPLRAWLVKSGIRPEKPVRLV